MYKIVICDIDGTLIDFKGKISEETIQAIQNIKDKGIEFALCTGRQGNFAKNILNRIGVKGYIISACGGEILDKDGSLLESDSVDLTSIKDIINYCQENDILSETLHDEFILTKTSDTIVDQLLAVAKTIASDPEEVLKYTNVFFRDFYLDCNRVDDPIKFIEDRGLNIYKLDIVSSDFEKLDYIRSIVDDRENLSHVSGFPTVVEISKKGIDKGVAVKKLCQHLKIDLKDAIAIGDSNNDEAMLKIVGMPVAMGNATDYIKSICKLETTSCDEAGVAEAIKKLIV